MPRHTLVLLVATLALSCQRHQQSSIRENGAVATQANSSTTNSKPAPIARHTAILAGGCFWGMEEILRAIPGVLETEVGYSGGDTPSPDYGEVSSGRSVHAESVR